MGHFHSVSAVARFGIHATLSHKTKSALLQAELRWSRTKHSPLFSLMPQVTSRFIISVNASPIASTRHEAAAVNTRAPMQSGAQPRERSLFSPILRCHLD
jgi:hypothetical protein